MTRHEAKEIIGDIAWEIYNQEVFDKEKIEALDMAVKVLEREPIEDCISREYLKSLSYINKGNFNSVETIREWIDNAPSVVPATEQSSMVDIVRCSDCKFNERCNFQNRYWIVDGFAEELEYCSLGKWSTNGVMKNEHARSNQNITQHCMVRNERG